MGAALSKTGCPDPGERIGAAAQLTDYTISRRGTTRSWVRHDCAKEPAFLDLLGRAEEWFADPAFVLVKDTLKTRVGRLQIRIGNGTRSVYLKRYNAFSFRYRLGSLFFRSAARRSLGGAKVLAQAGIASARPIAAIEVRRWGILERSFFVSDEIPGARTSDRHWRLSLKSAEGRTGFHMRREFLERLAALFADLHRKRIYHDDLKDANIMAWAGDAGVRFALLDLEGVRRCRRLSRRRRVKNLVQIYRTLGKYLTRSQKLFLLRRYLGSEFHRRALRRKWTADVLRLAARVDRRKLGEPARA